MDANIAHNIIMENRKKISVSAVEDVDSFDEHGVTVYTSMGALDIKGRDIHMTKLNLESGEIIVEGEFDSIIYPDSSKPPEKKGFLSSILK